ncbi:MAG: 3-phosphoserine/phosphohydroxythreonine transaminase [Clostridia bacterium]
MRVYNFSAGPSMLPEEVLKEAQRDMLDYNNSGMSVLEMSHRSSAYDAIQVECISLIKEVLNISDDYSILLVQGGASTQFEAVPLNLLNNITDKADYVVTGNFSNKAYKEAQKFGDIHLAGSSADKNFTYIPKLETLDVRSDAKYLHVTANNTIFGTKYSQFPKHDCLVCDMSSNILSEVVDFNQFGLVYAGAQKNLGPAGVTVVIVKKSLLENGQKICPTMLKYSTQASTDSMYNTPPCYSIYIAMLNLRHLKNLGGVKAMQAINEEKASLLYNFIDNSSFYKNTVEVNSRSIMNVPFVAPNDELNAKFVKEAGKNGLVSIKGHKLVGGMRASIYNNMPREGVVALIDFMKKFEQENK